MLRFLLIVCFFMMPGVMPAEATPPNTVDIIYDSEKENLMITADHRSIDLNEHYIRKAEVVINDKRLETVYYQRQPFADRFTTEIPLEVGPGDIVNIKLFCREGGTASGEIVIPDPEQPDSGL